MRIVRLAGFIVILAVAVACSSAAATNPVTDDEPVVSQVDNTDVTQAAAPPVQATFDQTNASVVARVNGTEISREVFDQALTRSFIAENAASQAALEQEVLRTLIEQHLIEQGAPELGVNVTTEDIDAEIDMLRSIATSDAQWEQFMSQNNFASEADVREAQRDMLLTRKVQDALLSEYLEGVEQVNARHIVVASLEDANTVLARLQAGEGFAALAAEYSIDSTTKDTGGNLGWFARNELFYKNLEDVAFELNPGDIGGPVATTIGYHIIQTMDKQVRPVEPERLPLLAENVFSAWLDEQYESSEIERYIEW